MKSAGNFFYNSSSEVEKGQWTEAKGIDPDSNQQSKTSSILLSYPFPYLEGIVI